MLIVVSGIEEITGVIQWMLNSAWPEMFWQLHDYYLRPNGAFYGTKKACAPLMPIYNYRNNRICVVKRCKRNWHRSTRRSGQ